MTNVNGVRRLIEVLIALVREPLAVIVLVLLFYMAQDAGWIPSKGRQAVELIAAHAARVDEVVKQRNETDRALVEILKRKAKIDQALCLAWARDPEIRRVCLEP